jgi:hypothetical protein
MYSERKGSTVYILSNEEKDFEKKGNHLSNEER